MVLSVKWPQKGVFPHRPDESIASERQHLVAVLEHQRADAARAAAPARKLLDPAAPHAAAVAIDTVLLVWLGLQPTVAHVRHALAWSNHLCSCPEPVLISHRDFNQKLKDM
jgi:hypothetical protein